MSWLDDFLTSTFNSAPQTNAGLLAQPESGDYGGLLGRPRQTGLFGFDPQAQASRSNQTMAMSFDGLCELPDGSTHPYTNAGGPFITIYGAGQDVDTTGQAGLGQAANSTAMPTKPKPGGIAGGGKSGKWTSPASSAARGLTGNARFDPLESLTGTGSVGGSIGKAIPFLGIPLMFADFMNHFNAPVCRPIA